MPGGVGVQGLVLGGVVVGDEVQAAALAIAPIERIRLYYLPRKVPAIRKLLQLSVQEFLEPILKVICQKLLLRLEIVEE